ncbi:MAG: peptidoglycan-binding protein [Paracoccaceae bacterium]
MKCIYAAALGAAISFGAVPGGQALAGNAALIIGNGDYAYAPGAATAERDTRSLSAAFQSAGWAVLQGTNLDRAGMRELITQFAAEAEDADAVAIFYSGHAIRAGGVSFLAPVETKAETLTDVVFDGVPLDLLLAIAGEKAGSAVLFVDGAQLRGFSPTDTFEPGLSDLEGPDGVLIISAAEPGKAVRRSSWRDSRFARLIVDRFLDPGASLMEVAENAPAPVWITGNVDREFSLAALPEAEAEGLEAEIELAYWRAAEKSGAAEDYQAYLKRFPNGIFAEFARARLGLSADAAVPEEPEVDPRIQAERDLNLSRARKRRLQEYLLALGYDPKGIDGLYGRGTRRAIVAWQRKNGMANEGWLTKDQVGLLTEQGEAALEEQRRIAEEQRRIREAEDNAYWSATGAKATQAGYRAYLEKYPEGQHSKIARAAMAKVAEAEADALARKERRVWRRAEKRATAEAYRNYLGEYPEGVYRDNALAKLDAIESAERNAALADKLTKIENSLNLSDNDMLSVEQRLRFLGFEVGAVDGLFDERTRAGIKGYQNTREMEETGYLNRPTVVQLVRDTNRPQVQQQVDGAKVIQNLLEALNAK